MLMVSALPMVALSGAAVTGLPFPALYALRAARLASIAIPLVIPRASSEGQDGASEQAEIQVVQEPAPEPSNESAVDVSLAEDTSAAGGATKPTVAVVPEDVAAASADPDADVGEWDIYLGS